MQLLGPLRVVLLFLIFLFNYSQTQNFTRDTFKERFSWSHLKSALKKNNLFQNQVLYFYSFFLFPLSHICFVSQWAFDSHCLIDFHSSFTLLYSLTLILSPTQTLNFDLSLYMAASTPKPSSWTLRLRVVRKKVTTRKKCPWKKRPERVCWKLLCLQSDISKGAHTHTRTYTRMYTYRCINTPALQEKHVLFAL